MTNIIYGLIWLAVTAADQLVKLGIVKNYDLYDRIGSLGNIADFVYVRNTGAAFSMLSGKLGLLSIISIAFCIGVVVYWFKKKPTHPLMCTALTLLASGALGNAIDRIIRGYVVDYISLSFISFPVFNIADIAITIGAVLMVVYVMFFDKESGAKSKEEKESDGDNT